MSKANLKRAFGPVDPSFENRVLRTLTTIEAQEDRVVRRKFSYGLIAAIALCVLLSGIALAAARQWGLMEFLNKGLVPMPTGAADLIERPEGTAEGKYATFTVREAIYDGHFVHLVVDAVPRDGVLLGGPMLDLDEPANNMGTAFEGDMTTVGDYAKKNGKHKVVAVTFGNQNNEECFFSSIDAEPLEDGSVAYQITGSVSGKAKGVLPIELRCLETEIVDYDDTFSECAIEFTLHAEGERNVVRSTSPVDFPEVGLTVDTVTISGSKMVNLLEIEFVVSDRAKWESLGEHPITWFNAMDDRGNALPISPTSWEDGTSPMEDVGELYAANRYQQTITLPAGELPRSITLAPYDYFEERLYEARTIELNG